MSRRLLAAALTTATAVTGVVVAAAPAEAASCTSPRVIYHTLITDRGTTVGYVDLESSTACHSVRAHVHSVYVSHPGDTHGVYGTIKRVGSSTQHTCDAADGSHDCTTAWLGDADPLRATATGSIDMYPVNYDVASATTPAF